MNAKKLRETGKKLLNKDMNKEKKEILNKLLEYFKESNINDFGYEKDKLISYKEAQILLDCISELEGKIEYLEYLKNENERLNNVIDELEKWLKEDVKDEKPDLYFQVLRKIDILDKLEELKGSVDE